MGIFSRLFGGSSGSSASTPKASAAGKVTFTTGAEEIVMPMAQAAFTPPAGLSPFSSTSGEQNPANTRIASPSLMGQGGMVTGIVYPQGMALPERVAWFLSRLAKEKVVERQERKSASGVDVLFLHLSGPPPTPGKADVHMMHCCFTNRAGDVADIYCIGTTEDHARGIIEAIIKTLRLL